MTKRTEECGRDRENKGRILIKLNFVGFPVSAHLHFRSFRMSACRSGNVLHEDLRGLREVRRVHGRRDCGAACRRQFPQRRQARLYQLNRTGVDVLNVFGPAAAK
jgi:hypothetical protein